jgi:hypothetical protein
MRESKYRIEMWARYMGGSSADPLIGHSAAAAAAEHLQTLTRACGGRKWRLWWLKELMRITEKKKNKIKV